MAGIYDRLMDGITLAQQGADVKKRSTLAGLYSQAIGAAPEQRQGYIGQMAALDPNAANTASTGLYKMDDSAKAALGQEAAVFAALPPDQKAQAYGRLAQHAQSIGIPVPMEYNPGMDENIGKLAQVLGGAGPGGNVQSTYIDAMGNRVAIMRDGTTAILGQNAPNNQIIDTGNGFYGVNKGNLNASPVMVGGQQQQAPQAPSGLVQTPSGPINIDPNLPPELRAQIAANPDAFTQGGTTQGAPVVQDGPPPMPTQGGQPSQQPQTALPPALDYQNGGQLRSAPKPVEAVTPLSPAEVAQLGLPPGTFAQRNTVTGELSFGPASVQAVEKPMTAYQQQQMQMKSGKAKAALSGTVSDLDRMGDAVRKVMNSPGLDRITGLMGALPNIPGSSAANAEADLDALKSQIAFAVLAKMRAMSPTGGALGNVSDAEGKRLEANLAALDKAQSADQMRARLKDILDYIESSKGNLRDAYNEQFGGQDQQASTPSAGWSIQKVN